jgi:pantoate kinase
MRAETDFPTSAGFSTSTAVSLLVLAVLALATAVETGFFDGR